MAKTRYDDTWHRLREWTKGQAPSERLAAQILAHEGFTDLDPSHPLGGKDGGKDAMATKNGVQFAMAVYFHGANKASGRSKRSSKGIAPELSVAPPAASHSLQIKSLL
ncbi:hypothetical protein [Belnapia moabensis]|uniref:hypothetical protein n=1 Tax=Belnapia moabensis TaxID=365533 RepID=UPI000A582569|nr:hypothetical protein [Belnapia moabensis]